MNWNSGTHEWTPVVGNATKDLRDRARALRSVGMSVREIAGRLGRSVSRIYELLR